MTDKIKNPDKDSGFSQIKRVEIFYSLTAVDKILFRIQMLQMMVSSTLTYNNNNH